MIFRTQILDCARLAVIANENAVIRTLIRGKGIAYYRNFADQIVPADLLAQISVVLQCKITQRPRRSNGQHNRGQVPTHDKQPGKVNRLNTQSNPGLPPAEPLLSHDCAHR